MYTLLYLKWTTSKDLCIAHGTLLNVTCQSGWEGCLKENGCVYMHGWDPYCSPEVTTTLFIGIPQYKMFLLLKKKLHGPSVTWQLQTQPLSFQPLLLLVLEQPHPPSPLPWREQACGNREQAGWSPQTTWTWSSIFPRNYRWWRGRKKKSQIITKKKYKITVKYKR